MVSGPRAMMAGVWLPWTVQYTCVARFAERVKLPICVMFVPRTETVEFQFGTGLEFVVTLVTAVPATTDKLDSPDILMPRSCSALALKSRLLSTPLGYRRAPNVFVGEVP